MNRKNKNIIILLIGVALLGMWSCESDFNPPDNPTVITKDVTNISNTSANVEISVNGDNYSDIKGVFYSSTTNTPDSKNGQKLETSYGSSVAFTNLTRGTTYYYRAYVTNSTDYIYGDVKTFTTTNIITPARVLTGSGYSTGYYSSKYHFSLNTYAWGLDEISEWGNQVSSTTDFTSPVTGSIAVANYVEGTAYLQGWQTGAGGYQYYRAYAKLKTGSYIYGDIKNVYVTY